MPSLNWLGRDAVVGHHYDVPFHFLDRTYGSGENSIIHGDNLLALKSLMPKYERRIKLIYIDPPYNTGNEGWVYNDNVNDPVIKKWLGEIIGREGEDFTRHDKWLCMMYPRLRLMHMLLADNGAIFISNDDNEHSRLRDICDEIFGSMNFVANVVWEKKYSPQNATQWLSDSHDYILIYAKNKSIWRPNLLPRTAEMNARYKNPDNDPRGSWKSGDLTSPATAAQRPNLVYPIVNPANGKVFPCNPNRVWAFSEENFKSMLADNRIWFGPDGLGVPRVKKFLSEVRQGSVSKTLWLRAEVGDNQEAKRELQTLFGGESVFDTPKPVRLLDKILRLSTDKDSIVLDAFGGSGTTAHAVINLNRTDGGERKFILIESQPYAETIIAERVRRVNPTVEFSFYEIGERLILEDGRLNPAVDLDRLREYVYFAETRQPLPTVDRKYLLGIHNGVAYYFLFERDRQLMLTADFVFSTLDDGAVERVIFAPATNCGDRFLGKYRAEFRRIPSGILLF